jgi:hypothetical protein
MVTKNYKAPTSDQTADFDTREKVYKVVCIGTEGKGLYSALAGKFGGDKIESQARLAYKTGFVTSDVEDGNGIFIYLDKEYAIEEATKMAERVDGRKLAVYYAKPIGDVTIPAGKSKTATAPAIILLDKLQDIAPAPKWEEVSLRGSKDLTFDNCFTCMEFYYKGTKIAHLNEDTGKLTANQSSNIKVEVNACHITKLQVKKD